MPKALAMLFRTGLGAAGLLRERPLGGLCQAEDTEGIRPVDTLIVHCDGAASARGHGRKDDGRATVRGHSSKPLGRAGLATNDVEISAIECDDQRFRETRKGSLP